MRESSWSMKGYIKAGLTLAATMVTYFVVKAGGASAESMARGSVEINLIEGNMPYTGLDEGMSFKESLPSWQSWIEQAEYISFPEEEMATSGWGEKVPNTKLVDVELSDRQNQASLIPSSSTMPIDSHFPAVVDLTTLNGKTGFRLIGNCTGSSVSGGQDINEDGIADLIIGAPLGNYALPDGSYQTNYGGISYVVFGNHSLNITSLMLDDLNGVIGVKIYSSTSNNYSGTSVALAGDVNGDNISDIIIGAPDSYQWNGPYFGLGGGYVVFGGRELMQQKVVNLSNLNGSNGFRIDGFATNAYTGTAVSGWDDINGDGIDDILINSGEAPYSYAIFGSLNLTQRASIPLANLDGITGVRFQGSSSFWALSNAGDINGDQIGDIIIGSDDCNPWYYGCSYLIFGGNWLSQQPIIDLLSLDESKAIQFNGTHEIDAFGWSVSGVGDLNGDAIDDIAMSASGNGGAVYIVFGGKWLAQQKSLNVSSLNGTTGVKFIDDSCGLGYSVSAAGDVNGDGIADMIMGSSCHSYIVFGGSWLMQQATISVSSFDGTYGMRLDNGGNSPVSGVGDINNDGVDDVIIGTGVCSYDKPPVLGISYVLYGDVPPVIINNSLSLHQGETVILNTTSLSATDRNYDNGTLVFVPSSVQKGHFEAVKTSGISLDNFTQQQVINGDIQFVHDGSSQVPDYDITVRSSGIAWTGPINANIVFYRQPQVTINSLFVNQGQSMAFTTNQLSFTDDYPSNQVVVEIVNLQHGQFQLMPQNTSIAQFTQQQLIENQIIFVQDGTSSSPAYQVIISDPYFKLAPLDAQVTFYRQPVWVNNKVSINQGQNLLITPDMLSVSDDYSQELVLFTVNSIQNAYFALTSGTTITQFSVAQLTGSQVKLVHDGSSIPPAYQVTGQDPYFSLPANQAVVFFYRSPAWVTNQLTITPGAIVLMTPMQMNVQDDYSDDQVIFKVSNLVGGQFESADSSHARIDQWTQQQIRSNQVQFHHNGADIAPNYLITANDPYFLLPPSAPVITYPPQIVNNQLVLLQGRASLLTASNLQATDVSPGITPQNLTFMISNIKYGQFTQVTNSSIAILSFTQAQINSGGIQFIQDGSRNVPAYITLVNDGRFNSSQQAGEVTLNTEPQLINNRLDIKQGASVVLTIANLKAVDDVTPDANLIFTLTNVQHGYFALVTQPDQPLSTFLQLKIINAEMEFIHDGSPTSPAYSVMATDGNGLSCPPQSAQISFTPSGGDALRIVNNQLQISQGRSVILSEENLSAVYDSNPAVELTFTVSNIQHGQFSWVDAPTNRTTQFSQQQINNLEVQFSQDGSRITPGYDVLVSGNGISTLPQAAKIFLNTAPLLLNNRLTLSPGQAVTFSTTNLLATDDTTADDQLQISIFNQSHGYFMMLETNRTILGFTQGDVDKLTVAFQHDGSLHAPAYLVMVTDSNGLSTDPQSAEIAFNLPPDTQTSTSLRNTIIGAIVSGVASLGFLGLKIFINRRADQYFEKAAESEGVAGEQVEFHKNVIRPIAKCILEYVKITGFMGYVSNRTMQDAFVAIIVLIDALSQKGVEVDLRRLTATQRARFLHTMARETRIKLVPEVGLCSCTRLVRFFTPEITPGQLEAEAENIAEAVKVKLGSYQPPSSDHDMKDTPFALPLSRSRLPLNIGRLDRNPETTNKCLLC